MPWPDSIYRKAFVIFFENLEVELRYLRNLALGGIVILLIFPFVTCSSNGTNGDNQPPSEPQAVAPPNGSSGITTTPTLRWSSVDPDGDAIYFDVYIGTDNNPTMVKEDNPGITYLPGTLEYSTTYYWKVVSKDHEGGATSSAVWSFTTKPMPAEVVTTPSTPIGPSGGQTSQQLDYTTGGSTSSYGHDVEYRFDWGNGTYTDWSSSTSASYTWTVIGLYAVKAQARCVTHPEIVSKWSSSKMVSINEFDEEISRPNIPTGPAGGPVNQPLSYSASGAISNQGHIVEYRFDWGDGEISDWSTATTRQHIWTETGIHILKTQGRCSIHNDIISEWSPQFEVIIF